MTLWMIAPSAGINDTRWLSFPVWNEVIVRAETAARARRVAAQMEAELIADATPVGNESLVFRSAFEDEKLYRVRRMTAGEAPDLAGEGEENVISATLGASPDPA